MYSTFMGDLKPGDVIRTKTSTLTVEDVVNVGNESLVTFVGREPRWYPNAKNVVVVKNEEN